MKIKFILILLWVGLYSFAQRDVNYDESKTPNYVLPDVLTLRSGEKVKTKAQWEKQRRPEVLEMFAAQMYGRTPKETIRVRYEKLTENPVDMGGRATSKQVKFIFSNGKKEIEAILLLYIPNEPKGKAPVFVGYNFKGNHSTTFDSTVYYSPGVRLAIKESHPDWVRGNQTTRWGYDEIIRRGYAVATMCYHDIFPDVPGMKDHSIVSLFSDYNPNTEAPDEWQAIGAWAWGSSRIVDYLETESRIDKDKIVIMGHSRQGKAALWAGAQDERFKIVIANNSGSGGAALSKPVLGETVAIVSSIKPPWFCPAFNQYHNNEANLPFDQHELLALIAPRKVYVSSAEKDLWADPKGEYLSAYHAGPVYKLYGLSTLESDRMPAIHQPVMEDIGYHIRAGEHDVTLYDWERFLDFADKHFKRNQHLSVQEPSFSVKQGVNISHWLSQSNQRGENRKRYFTRDDVKDLAGFGFDHLRIPVDEEQMFLESGEKDAEAFTLLHDAIGWCKEFGLKTLVDLHILRSHHFNAADKPLFTQKEAQEQFYNCWKLLSGELKKYPNDQVAYELMNEPVADDHEVWNVIVNRCIETVRQLEPKRTIYVGSNRWQSFSTVEHLRLPPGDKNIVISFHYYEPFGLTHYKASWTNMQKYTGPVHYPGLVAKPEDIAGQPEDVQKEFRYLTKQVYDREKMASDFQKVADVAKKWGLTVYCGEFGCILAAPVEDRNRWYHDMGSLFRQFGFGHATWDFKGGFGVKREGQWVKEIIDPLTKPMRFGDG